MSTLSNDLATSEFCSRLRPVGRILEDPDYNVWGCSPIFGPDGRVHVFYSRWPNEDQHQGWLTTSEICHAVADRPEGPYEIVGTVLKGRGGDGWDSMTIHNPTIHQVGDAYYLFHMANSDGTIATKRVGVAIATSLDGPWERQDAPLIDAGSDPSDWDSASASNPAFLQHPSGQYWLYYKGWNIQDWNHDLEQAARPDISTPVKRTNRQYGLAVADRPEGPYRKHPDNPIVNVRQVVPDAQCEDAYVWYQDETFHMVMRDMGYWNHEYGLLMTSQDGLHWGLPEISYLNAHAYFPEPPNHLDREGRFERPQLLMQDGAPRYLFAAIVGGRYGTSSGIVLKLD